MDKVITLLATDNDIEKLERTRTWGPMIVPPSMRDISRVELLDVSNNLCGTFMTVEDWVEVKPDSHLVMPKGIHVDNHMEPLFFDESLGGDLNEQVFGDRDKSAMHLLTEAHWHTMEDWLEVETARGHKHLVEECAGQSRDLRNDKGWTDARQLAYTHELLAEVFKGWGEMNDCPTCGR